MVIYFTKKKKNSRHHHRGILVEGNIIVKVRVVTSSQWEHKRPHIRDVTTRPRSDWLWRWLRLQLSHWP